MVVWVFVFCGCLLISKFWLVGAFVYSMCLMVPGFLIYVSWVFGCLLVVLVWHVDVCGLLG